MAAIPIGKKIVRSLRRLFRAEPKTVRAGVIERNRPDPIQPRTRAFAPLQRTAILPGTKTQMVRLTRIKAAFGQHWPNHADRICAFAESIVKKHLLQGDVYESAGDDGFLVLFAQLSLEDTRFKAEALSREIERLLVGSPTRGLSSYSAAEIPQPSGEEDIDTVRAGRSPIRSNLRSEAIRHRSGSSLQKRGDIDTVVRDGIFGRPPLVVYSNSARSSPTPQAGPVGEERFPAGQEEPMFSQLTVIHTDERGSPRQTAVFERRHRPRLIPAIRWFYRPVWDYKSSALILFALLPEPSYETIVNDGGVPKAFAMERRAEIDVAAILRASQDLAELARFHRRLPLIVQIHQETITNARRLAFILSTLRKVPPRFYRLLMFEIVGPEPTNCLGCLSDFIGSLNAMHIKTSVRLEPNWLSGPGIATCGASLVTLRFSEDWPEIARMEALGEMAARARLAKVDCGLWDIRTRSMAVAAASSGMRYLSGLAIAEDSPNLSHAVHYLPADLYSSLRRV
jgi:hypothetical protein